MREQPWLVSLDAQEARVCALAADAAAARARLAVTCRAYTQRIRRRLARPWVLGASFAGGFVIGGLAGPAREQPGGVEPNRLTVGSVAAAALWVLRFWESRPRKAAADVPVDAATATAPPVSTTG